MLSTSLSTGMGSHHVRQVHPVRDQERVYHSYKPTAPRRHPKIPAQGGDGAFLGQHSHGNPRPLGQAGYTEGPRSSPPMPVAIFSSTLSLGNIQDILNLKAINQFIQPMSFRMETLASRCRFRREMLSIQGSPLRPEAPLHASSPGWCRQWRPFSGSRVSGYSARRLANCSRQPRARKTASSPFPAVGAGVGLPSKLGKSILDPFPISDVDLPGQLARPTVETIAKFWQQPELSGGLLTRRLLHGCNFWDIWPVWWMFSQTVAFTSASFRYFLLRRRVLLYGPPRTGWPRP